MKTLSLSSFFMGISILLLNPAWANEVRFTASVESQTVSQDESVALKLNLEMDSGLSDAGTPTFKSEGFEVINEYSSSGMSSSYVSGSGGGMGKIVTRFTRTLTKLLRPLKTGKLQITDIRIQIAGKSYQADPITIEVFPAGSQAQVPRNFGNSPSTPGNRQQKGKQFFVTAEVSKSSAYKGEQIIVSYYLYRQVRVFNIEVVNYPLLKGFLREDLEMPILQRRLGGEQVMVEGVAYEKALLIRYAAYPLKNGELQIDPIGLRLNYYADGGDEERIDPFSSFFNNLAPKVGRASSEPVTVDILELPSEGKTASFTGGVGNFEVTWALDNPQPRAHETVTLKLKIEGRGNVAAIQEPSLQWPEGIELFDTTEQSKTTPGGVGDKYFEFLLIPRREGKVTLPSLQLSFFDPQKKKYYSQKTDPIELTVLPGNLPLSQANSETEKTPESGLSSDKKSQGILKQEPVFRDILPPSNLSVTFLGIPWYRWLYLLDFILFAILLYWMITDHYGYSFRQKWRGQKLEQLQRKNREKSWKKLQKLGSKLSESSQISAAYEALSQQLSSEIESILGGGSRSFSRQEQLAALKDRLGMSERSQKALSDFFVFADGLRYSGNQDKKLSEEAKHHYPVWLADCQSALSEVYGVQGSGVVLTSSEKMQN